MLATTALSGAGALYAARSHAASCDATFSFTAALQTCTVASAGTYSISAFGAQCGSSEDADGGLGGNIGGEFVFDVGVTLHILVGARSFYGEFGGSFIAEGANVALTDPLVGRWRRPRSWHEWRGRRHGRQ